MQKTLLLVFVHGFKGDDSTFQGFPSHLRALLSHALPQLNIKTVVYPQFSTTGDLSTCVTSFRDWLTNQVIDLEVERGTTSPTVDPGVRVILVGHSMGGIVNAEAVLGIVGEDSIDPSGLPDKEQQVAQKQGDTEEGNDNNDNDNESTDDFKSVDMDKSTLMFPHIQGLLAFDTPYLGISPGVVAHGAEKHWNTAKPWFETAAGFFAAGATAKGVSEATAKDQPPEPPPKSPPPPEAPTTPTNESGPDKTPTSPVSQQSKWSRWSKTAIFASAGAAAAAAAGTAAYLKRGEISSLGASSINWVSSHLQFVGCLARGEELRKRVEGVAKLRDGYDVGFANLYTILGKAAGAVSVEPEKEEGEAAVTQGQDRTFCNLPQESSGLRALFHNARNDKAPDEVTAHMFMFAPKENPGFYDMGDRARDLIVSWVDERWAQPDPDV